jgi:hypothetical protein
VLRSLVEFGTMRREYRAAAAWHREISAALTFYCLGALSCEIVD